MIWGSSGVVDWGLAKRAFLSFVTTYINVPNLVYGSVATVIVFLAWA